MAELTESPNNAVYYPAVTEDYYIKRDRAKGFGMYANRNIKKGNLVMRDGCEFMFSDVNEGDYLLMDRYQEASRISLTEVPARIPLTRKMLEQTHGIPVLIPAGEGDGIAGTITWRLEVPLMLINHSSNPNTYDDATGENRAARDIKKHEELTWNYFLSYYDKGPFFDTCLCGASNCRGELMGFKSLDKEEKKRLFPNASPAVRAMYLEDIGEGKPVKFEQITEFIPRGPTDLLRLVFSGPSYALAPIKIRHVDNKWGLYAAKDFKFGDKLYEFWRTHWIGDDAVIDMVFSSSLSEGDPQEGTTIRINAADCAYKDRNGKYMFSGWDLLRHHSSSPNMMYNDANEYEGDDWCTTYAAKEIKEGDLLTVDFNSVFWDRGDVSATVGGFKHLERKAQEELLQMNQRRVGPPYDGEKASTTRSRGRALSRHIRLCWKQEQDDDDLSITSSSSSSSSFSSSSSSSSDQEE